MTLADIILAGFRGAIGTMHSELPLMPLSRWDESVLRDYFWRAVAATSRETDKFAECSKIDLVLARLSCNARKMRAASRFRDTSC